MLYIKKELTRVHFDNIYEYKIYNYDSLQNSHKP